jgi:Tol biopolymer transport system component
MISSRTLTWIAAAALIVLPRGGGFDGAWVAPVAPAGVPDVRATHVGVEAPQDSREDPLPTELRTKVEVAARRAVRWLVHEQQQDGSWRSPQYGVLRGGQAYTPFVLHTLLALPPRLSSLEQNVTENAIAFIRSQMSEEGALGYQDKDVLEYPVYATSYAIRVFRIAAPDDPALRKMAAWLAGMQLVEAKGFKVETSPAYGGWGFGVATLAPGDPGHVDLAHTRRALEALREAGALNDDIRNRAQHFLDLLQKQPGAMKRFPGVPGFERVANQVPRDGGFFFSPVVLVANKALWEGPGRDHDAYFRSYSTATADGVLALCALEEPEESRSPSRFRSHYELDRQKAAAAKWLDEHWQVDVAGIPAGVPEPWVDALRYYNLAVMCEAATALKIAPRKLAPFAERLLSLQLPDGHFVNLDSTLMKEDDPVLATTLALTALGHVAGLKSVGPLPPPPKPPEPPPVVIEAYRQDLSWSPDARELAYSEYTRVSGAKAGKWAVWILAPDGSGFRKALDDASWVSWSRDGWLAFVSERDGNPEIYVARPDGTGIRRITNHGAKDLHPAWSPKGDRIAFSSTREGKAHIYLMAPDGSDVVRLTGSNVDEENPAWSPDGTRIAFHRKGDGRRQVYTIAPDGGGEIPIGTPETDNAYPGFLPTGRILFASTPQNAKPGLVIVDAEGGKRTPVGEPGAWFGRWSPDGTKVAFIIGTRPRTNVWVMNSNGSEKRMVAGEPEGVASAPTAERGR